MDDVWVSLDHSLDRAALMLPTQAFGVLLWTIFNGGQAPYADKSDVEIRQLKVVLPLPAAVRPP